MRPGLPHRSRESTHPFAPETTQPTAAQTVVPFVELAAGRAIRVVAIAPDCDLLIFRAIAKNLELPGASFSLGWTPWLDIAAEGVTKASAVEEIRARWAADRGRGVEMGGAPESLLSVASEITGSLEEDGLARALARL